MFVWFVEFGPLIDGLASTSHVYVFDELTHSERKHWKSTLAYFQHLS